jgi:hypothetical protein
MRLFPWGWLLYFQLASRLLHDITKNIPSSEHRDKLLKHNKHYFGLESRYITDDTAK